MSFPRYPAYKPSGVEWLGEVPSHWEVVRLRRISTSFCDGPFGSGLKTEHYTDSGVRVVRLQNIRLTGFDAADEAFIDASYFAAELLGHEVIADDVLIAGLGDDNHPVGRACVAPSSIEPAMVKADCFRFRLDPRQGRAKYVALALTAGAAYDGGMQSTGSTRSRMPLSVTAARKLPLPPLEEQTAISSFLHHETTKIDTLIAEQERLVALLTEKRQAMISHAVTKGLNPDAPMKDSGVEWIGQVPSHWNLPPLYTRYDQALGKMLDQARIAGDWPTRYLRNVDVRWGRFDTDDLPVMDIHPRERSRFTVRRGDLLLVEGRELGRCAIWEGDDDLIGFQKALHRLRPKSEDESPQFMFYTMYFANRCGAFHCDHSPDEIPHLTGEQLRRYRFATPPIAEQLAIVAHLDRETAKIDALTAEAQRAIALLRERRAALISAAVTGQIDVRGEAEAAS